MPGSLSPALLCGPSSLPGRECTRPALPWCPAAGRSCQPQAWGGTPASFPVSFAEQLGRGASRASRASGASGAGPTGSPRGLRGSRLTGGAQLPERLPLVGGPAGRRLVLRQGPGAWILSELDLFIFFAFAFASVLDEGVCLALLLSVQTTTSYADFRVTYS